METAIEILTEMKLKEFYKNKENNKKYYKVTMEDLINLSIKLIKVMEREL
jgi:hypothetical protein